jgi:hypothetical protein
MPEELPPVRWLSPGQGVDGCVISAHDHPDRYAPTGDPIHHAASRYSWHETPPFT